MAPPYGEYPPGGYRKRAPEEYDQALCLIPRDVIDFIIATQPKEWERLKQHYGASVREQFLKRPSREIARRGSLHNLSMFAFTATPKSKTLEIFGTKSSS